MDTSWATVVDAAEVKGKAKKNRKPNVKMENVVVASCSDDGSVRIWQPLQVKMSVTICQCLGNVMMMALLKSCNLWR